MLVGPIPGRYLPWIAAFAGLASTFLHLAKMLRKPSFFGTGISWQDPAS